MKYAFIDRDGTLIHEPSIEETVYSLNEIKLLNGAIDLLKFLKDEGYTLIMVSNQDFLGTKKYPKSIFNMVQNDLKRRFQLSGIKFEKTLICPHGPDENCNCRKPKTGLVAQITDIEVKESIMIGDRDSDMQFAENLGIRGYKIDTNGDLYQLLNELSK